MYDFDFAIFDDESCSLIVFTIEIRKMITKR